MNLPKIDISALPDLDTLTGISGSRANSGQNQFIDDSLIDVMVIVYEMTHHG